MYFLGKFPTKIQSFSVESSTTALEWVCEGATAATAEGAVERAAKEPVFGARGAKKSSKDAIESERRESVRKEECEKVLQHVTL